ncbi:hypothetical protein CR513_11200, partial [Mucuna pruriens]
MSYHTSVPIKYIEGDEEALETSFQSLEIASTAGAETEQEGFKPSRVVIMAARVLIKGGYQPCNGLGNKLEGIAEPAEALVEMKRLIEQERPKFQSLVEELEAINLGGEEEKKEVRVGKQMPPDLRRSLIELLEEYADVFAWSYQDMPGLDREIVEHRLPLLPNSVLVQQQLRRMKPEVALKIKEEVEK